MKRPPLKKIYNKFYINEQPSGRDTCQQLQSQNPEFYGFCLGHCNSILPAECITVGFESCCPEDEVRWTCTDCKGCERHENGEFTSEEECEADGCFSGTVNDYAISLGITDGVPGVDGTTMSAEDQYCIKCQSGSWPAGMDQRCECCNTDYTYSDNVITYGGNNDDGGGDVNPNVGNVAPLADKPKKARAPKQKLRESLKKIFQRRAGIKK